MSEARDEAGADWIRGLREHDGHAACRLLQPRHGRAGSRQDDLGHEGDQLRRVSAKEVGIARSPTIVNPYIAPDHPARLLQPLVKRCEASQRFGIVCGEVHEHADAPYALALLRARRERPRSRRAAEQRDELTPPHSITSSAATSSLSGTMRPSILAVGTLMTSSNFVDCTTGKSAGFAPLRMRAV